MVLALLAVIGLIRFGPMRNTERLRRVDPEAAARDEQRLIQDRMYRGGGF